MNANLRAHPVGVSDTNWHAWQSAISLTGGICYAAAATKEPELAIPFLTVAAMMGGIGLIKLPAAIKMQRCIKQRGRLSRPWLTLEELMSLCSQPANWYSRWIGFGYLWNASHRQNVLDLTKTNWVNQYHQRAQRAKIHRLIASNPIRALLHPLRTRASIRHIKEMVSLEPGFKWMQALDAEKPLYLSNQDLQGHMAVFGTTGAGKSRFLEHQIVQTILQGKTVIVVDPKGDKSLVQSMRSACRLASRQQDFHYFHPAFPEQSINLNLIANYSRPSEIASRIADTIPGQGGDGQVFIEMGRNELRTVIDALTMMGRKPTLKLLDHYYSDPQGMLIDAMTAYLEKIGLSDQVKSAKAGTKDRAALAQELASLYRSQPAHTSEADGIVARAERDFATILKTTASTWNVLHSLVRDDLGDKLSPDDEKSRASFFDTKKLLERNGVLYIGLDAMTDSGMARTIGSLLLADLAATAGARYDFENSSTPVALFVDEASEVMCEPFIQMLNKSRGANFTICLASQTVADFVAKLKDKANAMRILANLNNFVALRCNDADTQEFLVRRLTKVRVTSKQHTHGVSTSASSILAENSTISERLTEEEVDLVPSALLGALPNCEFFGIFAGGYVVKGRVPILVERESDYRRD